MRTIISLRSRGSSTGPAAGVGGYCRSWSGGTAARALPPLGKLSVRPLPPPATNATSPEGEGATP